jgi:two-component system probable response regulator PhcQ
MRKQYDFKKYAILYVDDEEMALKYFEKSYASEFRFYTAGSSTAGLKILQDHGDEIAILISDQRMPGEKGVQLLECARMMYPRIVRILITAYADFGVTVDAVNLGSIFRYLSKPIQVEDVRTTLHHAMDFFMLQQERDDLLKEKLSTLQNLLITDRIMSLGVISAGINQSLKNALPALAAFINLTPDRLCQQPLDLTKLSNPSFWHDFHGQVVKQSENIAKLIGSLMLPQKENAEFASEPILKRVIESNESQFQEQNVTLKFDIIGPLPSLHSNAEVFNRMMSFLLKAESSLTPAGGTVSVIARSRDAGLQMDFTTTVGSLSPELLGKVFNPFMMTTESSDTAALSLMGGFFLAYHLGGTITTLHGTEGQVIELTLPTRDVTPATGPESVREFINHVLMNDILWERLLPNR